MPRSHIGRFMSGRRGLRNVFKRNRKLRRALNQKERGHALKTLARFKKGRGITVRGGPGIRSELDRAYGKWRRDTKDPISKAQAKLIKRELEKYGRGLQQDDKHKRASRSYFRRHTDNFGSDPRANPSQDPNGVFRGDRDNRPSLMYGRSNFDDDEPDGSGYDHAGHLDDLRGLDDHTPPTDHPDDDTIPGRDPT